MHFHPKPLTPYKRDPDGKLIPGRFRTDEIAFLYHTEMPFAWHERVVGTPACLIYRHDGNVSYVGASPEAHLNERERRTLDWLADSPDFAKTFSHFEPGDRAALFGVLPEDGHFVLLDVYVTTTKDPNYKLWLTEDDVLDVAANMNFKVPSFIGHYTLPEMEGEFKWLSSYDAYDVDGVVGRPGVDLYDRFGNRIQVQLLSKDYQ